jgi:3'(2'), 5'-bisphosphate nucleotidase
MKTKLDKQLELSKELALKAGVIIMEIYNTPYVTEYKIDNSPVTIADKKANELIVSALKKAWPELAVLSEESEDDGSRLSNEWCWIIDPLDGTKEFVKKNGEFTVNIALAHKGRPVLGVVHMPATGEMYFAEKGKGAYLEKNGVVEKIKVSDRVDELRIFVSRSHPSPELDELLEKNKKKISKIMTSGSSIKGCVIAKGEADIYYRFNKTSEWDTAAMQCVIEEAGGIFREMDDSEMVYNRIDPVNRKGFFILNRIENKMR